MALGESGRPDRRPADNRAMRHVPRGRRLSILVADDDLAISASLEHLLTAAGHSVEVAPEVLLALQLVREHQYDLIFLDCAFPRLLELDFWAYLRESASQIPVVPISTNPSVKARLEAVSLAVANDAVRPFTLEEIQIEVSRGARVPVSEPMG